MIRSIINSSYIDNSKSDYLYGKKKINAEKNENLLSVIEISKERFSFYEQNKKYTNVLLNSINFYDGAD